jgi:glycosyltransferase involved in cell wall biosynthesis
LPSSLSLLLPVCNAQKGLESQVERVLDVLPELCEQFDVVIIDDGSTDETHEVASDLARRYPQVDVVRHSAPRGMEQAIATGRQRSSSDVVLVHASGGPLDSAALAELWSTTSGTAATPAPAIKPKKGAKSSSRRLRAATAVD